MVKLVETGVLKLGAAGGAKPIETFGLDDWSKAFTTAKENTGMGEFAVLAALDVELLHSKFPVGQTYCELL